MSASIHRRAFSGTLIGFVSFGASMLQNIVQVPFLLRYWGAETYGVWLALTSFVGFVTLLDNGHQNYIGNMLNQRYADDRELFCVTLGSAVRFALIVAVCSVLISLAVAGSPWLGSIAGIKLARFPEAPAVLAILAIGWIATGSISSVLVRLYPPTGHFTRAQVWSVLMRAAQFLAVILPAAYGKGLVFTAVAFGAVTTVVTLAIVWDLRVLLPEFYPWWRTGSYLEGWRNFRSSIVLSGTSVFDGFVQQGMVILVGNRLGAAEIPLFTTMRTLANTAVQVSSIMLNPVIPDMVRYRVRREWGKLTAVFSFHWFVSTLSIDGGIVVFVLFARPIYQLWTHGALRFDPWLFAALQVMVAVRVFGTPMASYLVGMNRLRAQCAISVARGILALGIAALLVGPFGVDASGWALLGAELIGGALLPLAFVNWEFSHEGQTLPWRPMTLGLAGVPCVMIAQARQFSVGSLGLGMLALAAVSIGAVSWAALQGLPAAVVQRFPVLGVWHRRMASTS